MHFCSIVIGLSIFSSQSECLKCAQHNFILIISNRIGPSLLGKAPSTDSYGAKSLPTLRRILYSHKNGYNCRQIFVIFGQKQFHSTRPILEGWRTEGWVWGVAPPTPLLTPNPDGETSRNCQSRELVIKIWSIQMKQENPVKANNQIAEFFLLEHTLKN